ncbi:histidine kinase [Chitinophaga niabensis]|uniref:sensor histidine kinase n=1 Tax=Chitinophaga niabensis TaxID=536979 RepID=UPI0031BA6840
MDQLERKLHIYGYLAITVFFVVFYMLEMFFGAWKIDHLVLKIICVTIPFTLAIWMPTHWVVMWLRKRMPGMKLAWKRLCSAFLILLPYGMILGFTRVFLENYTLIWQKAIPFVWYYTWTSGMVVLIIFLQIAVYESIYYLIEWKKVSSEAEELKQLHLKMQFDSLKVQIQPHFLFNTLNTLIGLIEMDPKKARTFTEELAYVYRYLLEANDRAMISLEEELAFSKAYFFLLKNRYEEGLYLEIIGENDLNHYKIPPLSLQILLENAIKHNVITRARPLYIQIHVDHLAKQVTVVNNLQRKPVVDCTGKGLLHMEKKFRLMNLPDIKIEEAPDTFSVTVPLIKAHEYESINY